MKISNQLTRTASHEMAHQLGISNESDNNFVALFQV